MDGGEAGTTTSLDIGAVAKRLRNQVVSTFVFICDESLTHRGLNLNTGHFCGSSILPLFVWRIMFACLVVCRCDLTGSDEDHVWSKRPGVEDRA
jgi:hypothetical protein